MRTSIIIITLNRPDYVRKCLAKLNQQTVKPGQIIVVDASRNNLTKQVVKKFAGVLYMNNQKGIGKMTTSRNLGLTQATGDIICFLDDDSFAGPDWLENILKTYKDKNVGAVGGRALNNLPDEAKIGLDRIGKFSEGVLYGFFAADPGKIIEVDHIMGCNMTYRREVLQKLGGFREDYTGISGLREDSDPCFRVRKLGYRILFNPKAWVEHLGAPQASGNRFDYRYQYFGHRNHSMLLLNNFGLFSVLYWKFVCKSIIEIIFEFIRRITAAVVRMLGSFCGLLSGFLHGILAILVRGTSPIQKNRKGKAISACLAKK